MTNCQVTCIHKPNRNSTHEHITHIGGPGNGKRWLLTREDAIRRIELKTDSFYVIDKVTGKRSDIGVVYPNVPGQHPYLRTHADGYYNNNLLGLDECPLR